MSRYIDAELLKQILKPREWGTPDERWIPEHEIGAMLDYFPAADVQEVMTEDDVKEWCIKRNYALVAREDFPDMMGVRHGRWLMTDAYPHKVYCSECYATLIPNVEWFKTYNIASNYCPNCGAAMIEEEE